MTDATPSPTDRLKIRTDVQGGRPVFILSGELDPHTSPMLQEQIDATLSDDASAAVLDFTDVGFVDSAGLRVIADTHRRLSEAGGGLVLRGTSAGLDKLLSVTGLSDHVEVER